MRTSRDHYLMDLALRAAEQTTCIRRAVGCVLADERGGVLAVNYNGVARGMPHCNEKREVHYASVPVNPEHPNWATEEPWPVQEAAFYFRRANELSPTLASRLGGELRPLRLEESSVKGDIAVVALHMPHMCLDHALQAGQDSCEAVHAEQNALVQCRDADKIYATYVTLSPCKACLKLLLGTDCQRIIFAAEHDDPWPKEQWLKAGRDWEKLSA